MTAVGWILFILGLSGVVSVLALNPVLLLVHGLAVAGRRRANTLGDTATNLTRVPEGSLPQISLITVFHGAGPLLSKKLENALSLDYPRDRLQVILFSDGPDQASQEQVRAFGHGFLYGSSETRAGKNRALNEAVAMATGEVLVFSDLDAVLDEDALKRLLSALADPSVGGVCGQRRVADRPEDFKSSQATYVRFDSLIKILESRTGSISSNDGKLYAIRRSLFRTIPDGVTDDLYTCLSVVGQGARYIFERAAVATVRTPSREPAHEIQRRRRIVCRSLTGLFLNRAVFNPIRFGLHAVRVAVNKGVRRLLPVCLLLLLVGSAVLSVHSVCATVLLWAQIAFYAFALAGWVLYRLTWTCGAATQFFAVAFYFCVGNVGTLLGVIDFLCGKRYVTWEPVKDEGVRS